MTQITREDIIEQLKEAYPDEMSYLPPKIIDMVVAYRLQNPNQKIQKPTTVKRNNSFEGQYWNGLIIFSDVPHLVEGWFQWELAQQYHADPPDYPAFVNIAKVKR